MANKTPQQKEPKIKEFSEKEIASFFEELNNAGKTFTSTPAPEHRDTASNWITTSGSSKQSNKLIKVSAWQTGQAS